MDFETMQLRERSAIASEALSELSALSGYRPQAVENRGQDSMPRRTPQATPGTRARRRSRPPVPHRERSATDVRSMLSGFRAGVERGRADKTARIRQLVHRPQQPSAQAGPPTDRRNEQPDPPEEDHRERDDEH